MRFALALALLIGCNSDDVSRTLGARCDKTSECDDRCLPPSTDYPDGFCTVDCLSSDDCPGVSDCIDRDGGICLFQCTTDESCRFLGAGWTCKSENLRADDSKQVMVCRGD